MSPLLLALLLVGGLAAANFLSAAAIRLRMAWKARHWEPVRTRLAADVAMYCVEALDELPPTPRRRDRRLLREVMLETAPEVSGGALERLRAAFAERGFLAEARRGMRARPFLARVRAAEALGALGGDDARDALLLGLEDDEALVRIASAHALVRTGATDVLRSIVTALANPDDEAARGALAEALLDAGPPAVDELLAALHDDALGPRVRWLVVVVLGELRAIAAVEDLLACLGSGDDELRARAAHALGKIGDPRAVPVLDAIAEAGEPWQVRTAASAALGGLGDPRAVDGLLQALAAGEWSVRDAAARSLTELGEPAVEAVAARAADLPPASVAHFWGRLDVAWRTDAILERAAEGDELAGKLARAAAEAGATARIEERARAEDRAARWAREALPTEASP